MERVRTKQGDGFTLLEVLIALAIFSVVIAALYGTFFFSEKAVDAVGDSLLRLQEARSLVDTLKRELESAFYDSTLTSNNKSYTVFKIDDRDYYGKQASQVLFTSFSPLLPGLARITYIVEETDGKLTLKKKIISAFAQKDETKSVELMEEIDSFTIEAKFGDKWVKTWDTALTKKQPDEIRISLKIRTKKDTGKEKERSPERTDSDSMTISDIAKPRFRQTI
ncbi:MAG TPA: prepilin-type N-terminal cleavage/methylation domain-containing protein [Thermodesulfovibrionales bacterium]|nr:prepilin-type N-terminal cleavage/methylation domain-containing protein [Thermodesulfovibrionales bacterium]